MTVNDSATLDWSGTVPGIALSGGETGTLVQNGGVVKGQQASSGRACCSGPGLILGSTPYFGAGASDAEYDLNGGILMVASIYNINGAWGIPPLPPSGSAVFRFNGGTLQATQNDSTDPDVVSEGCTHLMGNLSHAYVGLNGANIDVNSFSCGIDQALEHDPGLGTTPDGGLHAMSTGGPGTLSLYKINTFTGPLAIDSGVTVNLAYTGGQYSVASVSIGGVDQGTGTFGATANNPGGVFTGTGTVTVGPPPPPTKLVFSSVPAHPAAGQPFSVTVQAQDTDGFLRNVTGDTTVQLSKGSGSGTLSGTTSGTIVSGTGSVTISGVIYSAADTLTLTATATSGMSLTTATTSLTFVVRPLISNGDFSTNAALYTTWPCYNGDSGNPAAPTYWTTSGSYGGVNGVDTPTSVFFDSSAGPWTSDSGRTVRDFYFQQLAGGTISQPVTTISGHTYEVTFDAATRAGGSTGEWSVSIGTNTFDTGTGLSASQWQGYSFTFEGTGAANDLTFTAKQVSQNLANVAIDDLDAPPTQLTFTSVPAGWGGTAVQRDGAGAGHPWCPEKCDERHHGAIERCLRFRDIDRNDQWNDYQRDGQRYHLGGDLLGGGHDDFDRQNEFRDELDGRHQPVHHILAVRRDRESGLYSHYQQRKYHTHLYQRQRHVDAAGRSQHH